jgi:FkbM family methyltransferase
MYPSWTLPFAWYSRREFPGWGHLLGWLRVMPPLTTDHLWQKAPSLFVELPAKGHVIQADLRDCVERSFYFLGRHPDVELQLCIENLLRAGDRYIDVGAHIGMLAIPAASLVGDQGEVLAFEPNPINMSRLARCVGLNKLANMRLFDCALSDLTGEAAFNFPLGAATRGSLLSATGSEGAMTFNVKTARGDDLFLPLDARPTLVKVDVEGFEIEVIEGCREYISRAHPALITECYGPNFSQSGTTVAAFLKIMKDTGARGFLMQADTKRFNRPKLKLEPIEQVSLELFETHCEDILWLFEESALWDRAKPWMKVV